MVNLSFDELQSRKKYNYKYESFDSIKTKHDDLYPFYLYLKTEKTNFTSVDIFIEPIKKYALDFKIKDWNTHTELICGFYNTSDIEQFKNEICHYDNYDFLITNKRDLIPNKI